MVSFGIAMKDSKYEWDLKKYGLDHEGLIEMYAREGADFDSIWNSHLRQNAALEAIRDALGSSAVIYPSELDQDSLKAYDFVVALGGDDHFKLVAHYAGDGYIIGVNSDPLTSEGALLGYDVGSLIEDIEKIESGDFDVEEWARIGCDIDGVSAVPAISEFYVGADRSKDMSSYELEFRGQSEVQKSSGIIIATGAGSTGWYRVAGSGNNTPFSPDEKELRFVVREGMKGNLYCPTVLSGRLVEGDELNLRSLMKGDASVSSDCIKDYNFGLGTSAVFYLSDEPLNVIGPEKKERRL